MVELGVPTANFGKIPEGGEPAFPGVSASFAPVAQLHIYRDRLRNERIAREQGQLVESMQLTRGGLNAILSSGKTRGMDIMPGYSNIHTVYENSGFSFDVGTSRWHPPTDADLKTAEKEQRRDRRRRRDGGSKVSGSSRASEVGGSMPNLGGMGRSASDSQISACRPGTGGRSVLSVAPASSILSCTLPPVRSSLAVSQPPIFGSSSHLPWADIP